MDVLTKGKLAQGMKELKAFRGGKRLTQRQAILAKCYECMGGYMDGKHDCGVDGCTLHPLMPYRGKGGDDGKA